jgi:hypothetical protein
VNVAEFAVGAKVATFEKPERLGQHMRPLFVKGYIEGRPVQRIMVDGGAGVNVMRVSMFEKMGLGEGELMNTNTSLSVFTREITETRGVLSVELTVGSKTMPTTFFVVDVKGRYNLLLGRDWIHANGRVPSTLHQCLIQWVGDNVEVVAVDEMVCVASAETPDEIQNGRAACLSGKDLSEYDYISVRRDRLVLVNVKPMSVTQLIHFGDQ